MSIPYAGRLSDEAGQPMAGGGCSFRFALYKALAGGGYRLDSLAWQVEGTAGGGGYSLLSPVRPMLRGSGCCCTYLPSLWCNR